MTPVTATLYNELKFQLDLMRLLDGCEECYLAEPRPEANATADLALKLTQRSKSRQ